MVARASSNPPWTENDARLVLEDGSVWPGIAFGARASAVGEAVFNTSLTGYQEILTDPSYKGQFVVFTVPHIGNVGINPEDMESGKVHLSGVIVRDLSSAVSNYRSRQTLDEYLRRQGVPGIAGVDTRALTLRLRETGCLNAVICADASVPDEELVERARAFSIVGKDLISEVTCPEPYVWSEGATAAEWEFSGPARISAADKEARPFAVVAYDFGIKRNILRRLASFGCKLTVVPASTPAADVLAMSPDGVFLSNGPGDPSAVPYAVAAAKELLGKQPIFGICMGHQVLGQALGGSTFKLKFGHHGGNHPIRYKPSGRVEISAQNHNFAVDPATLPADAEVTHINLNDGTCAGILVKDKAALGIQYHPEASPGPHDADVCFEMFVEEMAKARAAKKDAVAA